ncbi:hypothetical protein BDW22DRAFT_1432152 [Trametopsis cervina]|nr:hypothetical protein BDW22DRAFT_1432152 [Trametopsis cervina]
MSTDRANSDETTLFEMPGGLKEFDSTESWSASDAGNKTELNRLEDRVAALEGEETGLKEVYDRKLRDMQSVLDQKLMDMVSLLNFEKARLNEQLKNDCNERIVDTHQAYDEQFWHLKEEAEIWMAGLENQCEAVLDAANQQLSEYQKAAEDAQKNRDKEVKAVLSRLEHLCAALGHQGIEKKYLHNGTEKQWIMGAVSCGLLAMAAMYYYN